MTRTLYALIILLVAGVATNRGLGQDSKEITDAAGKSHFLFPSPPLEYFLIRQPVVVQEKFFGFQTTIQSEGAHNKVVARVDLREDADFSVRGYRSGAIKGYVNGFVRGLDNAGFKLVNKKLPDIENDELTGTLIVELEFKNDQQQQLFVSKRVLFDSRGIDITVIADNKDDFAKLKSWADRIQVTAGE